MGTRRVGPRLQTYIACMIGSFLLGLAITLWYTRNHSDTMTLPILGGMVLVVLGGGMSVLIHSVRVRLLLLCTASIGAAALCIGYLS